MMINTKTAIQQARIYIYELDNCAREFGFKADEGWKLNVLSDAEKVVVEKQYHPVISVKALPEVLSELFNLVKDALSQVKPNIINSMTPENLSMCGLQYLVAYNPKRVR
ncbi:hypothetical protein R1T15_25260 [Mucilaginibacter sp. L3T2-6]|uniref:Uncharacterized protein n=1 Tax=Mucilaginibacter mali TaxID=2740462 RepID=A0A7D4QSX2_9SPHI|nr:MULTISPECIES: hypothetical protein [Mucilaginibacter]MDV6217847.1 hypothetical protein [Mucilaginibacter sp. L3T2-6]QKJ30289.1 hypothetical protein HQ865_11115 [Mucilaginibacter mali]